MGSAKGKLTSSFPAMELIEGDEECTHSVFCEKCMASRVAASVLAGEWKRYVVGMRNEIFL